MNKLYIRIQFCLPLFFLLLFANTIFSQTVLTYNAASPGTGTWLCPAGVTSIQVETWGGGGGGGYARNTNGYGGGGGGGGAYTMAATIAVTPGTTYYYTIGAAGAGGLVASNSPATAGSMSCFSTAAACSGILSSANGGNGGTAAIVPASAAGPGGAGGIGGTFNGGNGGNGINATNATGGGGGGGGGASTSGAGGNGTGKTAGLGAAVGGGNGAAGAQGTAGASGNVIGGGGSGGHRTGGNNQNGGAGATGQIRLTYTLPACVAPSQATGFSLGTATSNSVTANFTGTASEYLVISSLTNTPPTQPVNGTTYSAANIGTLGAGFTFVQSSASTTLAQTGLAGNTRYYYFIYAFNSGTCSGGPTYNTLGPLTGNGVTCAAVPNTVNVTAITGSSFTINWTAPTGGSAAAVTYVLQVTSDAGFAVNVGASPYSLGAGTITRNITGLAPGTTYYFRILATNGCSSSYVTGSALTTGGYCTATTTSTAGAEYISNFTTTGGISNINNTTGFSTTGYGDYTGISVSQLAGQSINFASTYIGGTERFGIWVDWNGDGDFVDTGENVFLAPSNQNSHTGGFTVPAATPSGSYRMRIRGNWQIATVAPCGTLTYGETEDYTFLVTAPLPCPTFPTSLSTTALTTTTATLNWGAPSPAPANGYEYYYSMSPTTPTAGTTPSGSVGAGITSANITGLTPNTTYYFWIRSNCNGSDKGFWVGSGTFYTAFCTPSSTGTTVYISNFTITGGITNFNNNSGFTPGGYANYTAISASQQPYASVNFSSSFNGEDFGFNIWIDWNNDLDFNDAGEKVYQSGAYVFGATGSFAVPGTASVGAHRMRIRGHYWSTNPSACGIIDDGEAEDYTFTVVALSCSGNPTNLPATGIGLTTATINWNAASPAPANGYQYYYSTGATVPGYATTPSGSTAAGVLTANLTPLASGTLYHVWVRSNCGGNYGVWIGPITFTTNVAPPVTTSASVCQGGSGSVSGIAACTGSTNLGNTISGSWDATSDPRAVRPLIFIANSPFCQFDTGGLTANYTALNFTVSVTGSYTFTMPNTTAYDAMGYIVLPPFTPGDCASGTWIVGDDDSGATLFEPLMTATLTSGTIYTLYTTLYSGADIALTNTYQWDVTGPGTISGMTAGALQWYTAASGGTPIATGSNFNPIGIPGSGLSNTNTPGTTVYYAACSGSPGIRTATNYVITGPTAVLSGDGPVCSPTGTVMTVNFTGTAPWTFTYTNGVTPVTVTTSLNPYTFTVTPSVASTYTLSALNDFNCTAVAANRTGTGNVRSKTWNGSGGTDWNTAGNWTPGGVPTSSDCVVIPDVTNDPIVNTGNAYAYNLTVLSGGILQINSTYAITVTDIVNVNAGGQFNIQNSGSLIQVNNVANSGIINMIRITPPMYRYDYTYWGSPVTLASNYTLGMLSPNTLSDKYFSWIPFVGSSFGTWLHESTATVMDPRKGYIIRAPQTYSTDPLTKVAYTATFTGVPNNGTINCPILFGTMGAATNNDKYNLLGNPYPSSVSAASFLNLPNNVNVIDGTIYFWTHNSAISAVYTDPFYNDFVYNYTGSDYASWNRLGGVGTAASTGGAAPNGYIGAGQSFFTKSLTVAGGNAIFNNSMRSAAYSNTQFFRNGNATATSDPEEDFEKHRIWLNLTSPITFSQILIGYADGASMNKDRNYDGLRFDYETGNCLYSIIPNEEPLVIQGRPLPFDEYDLVPLGYISTVNGEFSIRIDHFDGVFDAQNIYLEDKLLNIIHDLRLSPYTFTTAIGRFDERFVLRYTNSALGNTGFGTNGLSAFIDNHKLHASATESIESIDVFELNGKLVQSYRPSVKMKTFEDDFIFATGIYFAKIKLGNGTIATQKLMNK